MNLKPILESVAKLTPEEKYFKIVKEKYNLKFNLSEKVLNIKVKRSERPLLKVIGACKNIMYGDMVIFKILKRRVPGSFRDMMFIHFKGDADTIMVKASTASKIIISAERKHKQKMEFEKGIH